MMQLSLNGAALIKQFEGLRLQAYTDVAGVWTIGYGSTRYPDARAVKKGDVLPDEAAASALFLHTLGQYEEAVNRLVRIPLAQHQYDALVSFTYNEGTGALAASTLLKQLNAGQHLQAANQLLAWNKTTDPHTGKKVLNNNLQQRREKERAYFLQL